MGESPSFTSSEARPNRKLTDLPFPPPPLLAVSRYTAIGTHLAVSGIFIGGLYTAISWGVDVASLLENVPLLNKIPGTHQLRGVTSRGQGAALGAGQ